MPKSKGAVPGMYTRSCEMELRQDGENENRFELSFSSEAPYMRWSGMPEILVHTKKAVDFTRLRTAGALLFDHGCDSRIGRMPVGLIKSVTLDEEAHKGRAVIEFDPDDEDSLKIRSKLQKKMLNGISVGYRVTEWQVLREGEKSADGRFAGPCYLATKWEPLEISVVATPADPTVGVGRSISNEEDNDMPEIETVTRTGEGAGAPPAAPAADNQAAVDAAVENERARAAAITTRCRHFGVSPDDYIARGLTVEQVNEDLLSTMEQRRQPLTGSSVGVVRDEGDKFRAAAADSILLRAGREVEKPADGARDLRSLTLRDIARSTLRIEGVEGWERMSNDQLFRAIVSPGSAFSSIMDDCVHKTMSNAYKTADTTFQLWTSKGTHADFRPKKIYEISEAGELDEVRENGEFKFGGVSDDSVTSVLATFGKKFGFTRKALIDDDLDVLTKIPAAYVRAAKRGVNKAVYNLLIKNPVMADGKNLFSADHGNIGTAAAPSVGSYSEALGLMAAQKDSGGKAFLNIRPRFILCSPFAYAEHAQMIHSVADPNGKNSAVVNPFDEQHFGLQLVMDAELNELKNGSAYPYIFAADSNSCGTIEVGYLNGNEEPILESRAGFDFLGIEWRIYTDYSVTLLNHRGFVKNADV